MEGFCEVYYERVKFHWAELVLLAGVLASVPDDEGENKEEIGLGGGRDLEGQQLLVIKKDEERKVQSALS